QRAAQRQDQVFQQVSATEEHGARAYGPDGRSLHAATERAWLATVRRKFPRFRSRSGAAATKEESPDGYRPHRAHTGDPGRGLQLPPNASPPALPGCWRLSWPPSHPPAKFQLPPPPRQGVVAISGPEIATTPWRGGGGNWNFAGGWDGGHERRQHPGSAGGDAFGGSCNPRPGSPVWARWGR